MPKSMKIHNARNYLFYNRKHGSGHLKSHEKLIKNNYKSLKIISNYLENQESL